MKSGTLGTSNELGPGTLRSRIIMIFLHKNRGSDLQGTGAQRVRGEKQCNFPAGLVLPGCPLCHPACTRGVVFLLGLAWASQKPCLLHGPNSSPFQLQLGQEGDWQHLLDLGWDWEEGRDPACPAQLQVGGKGAGRTKLENKVSSDRSDVWEHINLPVEVTIPAKNAAVTCQSRCWKQFWILTSQEVS